MSQTTTVWDRYGEDEVPAFHAAGFWREEGLFDLVDAKARHYGERFSLSTARPH